MKSSIQLKRSALPGCSLSSSLFYTSTTWLSLLTADVDALLSHFVTASTAQTGKGKGRQAPALSEDDDAMEDWHSEESPFEYFKRLWVHQGWAKLHLLGIGEGPDRQNWGHSITRAFLDELGPSKQAGGARQAGAVFALYLFTALQAPTMETIYIQLDPPTLNYILTLPTQYTASSLHLDLVQTLSSLLTPPSVIHLVPTPPYSHPPLPAISIKDARLPLRYQTAKLVLGAQDEALSLRRDAAGGHDATFERALAELEERRREYVETKARYLPFSDVFQSQGAAEARAMMAEAEQVTQEALRGKGVDKKTKKKGGGAKEKEGEGDTLAVALIQDAIEHQEERHGRPGTGGLMSLVRDRKRPRDQDEDVDQEPEKGLDTLRILVNESAAEGGST